MRLRSSSEVGNRNVEPLAFGRVTLELMLQIPDTNFGPEEFGIPLGDGASGLYRLDVAGNTCWKHRRA